MMSFGSKQIQEAIAYANDGGQALHIWSGFSNDTDPATGRAVPACFRHGGPWAHLLDNDRARLIRTARRLGVRRIVVANEGKAGRQHVDLCGKPLRRAVVMCAPYRPEDAL